MSESSHDQRTEEPSRLRLERARRDGHFAVVRDLGPAVGLLIAALVLGWCGPLWLASLKLELRSGLSTLGNSMAGFTTEGVSHLLARTTFSVLGLGSLLGGTVVLGSIAAGLAQTGGLVRWASAAPDPGRLSPVTGMSRLLKARNVARGAFSLTKVFVVVWLLYSAIARFLGEGLTLALGGTWATGWILLWEAFSALLLRLALALVGLALVDLALQRWLYRRDLRMTRGELIEELSEIEGDPELKLKRRHLRRELGTARAGHGEVR